MSTFKSSLVLILILPLISEVTNFSKLYPLSLLCLKRWLDKKSRVEGCPHVPLFWWVAQTSSFGEMHPPHRGNISPCVSLSIFSKPCHLYSITSGKLFISGKELEHPWFHSFCKAQLVGITKG